MTATPDTPPLRPWVGRAILHVDMDAFFAAVEQLDHPEWRGKPVIVGGDADRRGVVSTASYEARRFGVRSAMSSARARVLCPDAIWAPGRFARYKELSDAVRAIFADESPLVQPVSIDEAYLDVTPGRFAAEHPVEIARRIQARVDELGITCSIGVAATKSAAKVASDMDKPHGITVVWPGEEAAFLAPLPVGVLQGIGPKTAERLADLGLSTLADLAALDEITATQVLGSHGQGVVARARGIDDRLVHPNDPAKSVSNERTFAEDVRDPAEVDRALDALAARVGSRLRRAGRAGRTVTVKVRFSDFSTRTVRRTLPVATDDESEFGPVARELLRQAWAPGVGVRLLGVGLSGFDSKAVQLDLLGGDTHNDAPAACNARTRRPGLVKGVDAVRERFGDDALRFGREFRPGARDEQHPRTGDAPQASDATNDRKRPEEPT